MGRVVHKREPKSRKTFLKLITFFYRRHSRRSFDDVVCISTEKSTVTTSTAWKIVLEINHNRKMRLSRVQERWFRIVDEDWPAWRPLRISLNWSALVGWSGDFSFFSLFIVFFSHIIFAAFYIFSRELSMLRPCYCWWMCFFVIFSRFFFSVLFSIHRVVMNWSLLNFVFS